MDYRLPKKGDIYKVKYAPSYGKGAFRLFVTKGSNVMRPSGTHEICLKEGDIIEFESIAFDGTVWFRYKGEPVKFISNGWSPMLSKNLTLI